MNGAHDLGGGQGHGPIGPDPNEPIFKDEWERRCFALTLAMGFTGQWNLDQSRFAREQMRPGLYLETSYYEHWLHGLEVLLEDRGLTAPEAGPLPRILKGETVETVLKKGGTARRAEADAGPQKFKEGDLVRAVNIHPKGHTRVPRYVRGRRGRVEKVHGVFVFPDSHAATGDENPQWLYAVRFEGQELWGPDAEPGTSTYVDLWDDHLEPA